MSAVEVNTAL